MTTMNDNNNDSSLERMIAISETLRNQAETAQRLYEESLLALAKAHGTTYVNPSTGQVFQVRHRKDSRLGRPLTYLCTLKAQPKNRLSRQATAGEETGEEAVFAAAADSVVPEHGGATVIE